MAVKRRYWVTLPPSTVAGCLAGARARPISDSDADELGQLMLDAYRDTIDYEGETLNDAVGIVQQLMDRDDSLWEHSRAVEVDHTTVAAALVTRSEGHPFLSYVVTHPDHQNHGYARLAVSSALASLAAAGHSHAVWYVTEGNTASEALSRSLGAVMASP